MLHYLCCLIKTESDVGWIMKRNFNCCHFSLKPLAGLVLTGLILGGCQTTGEDGAHGFFSGTVESPYEAKTPLGKAKKNFREGNYGLAENQFRALLEKDDDNLDAWVGLAASYDQLGRFDLSDKAYHRALKIAGRRPEILNNLGFSYLMRGENAKARTILLEALDKDPDNQNIRGNLALLDQKAAQ
jgi:Tfp pilus assembly protein PilF